MPDIDLGKQIGPLPLGAWVVVVGAGVGLALYSRNANPPAPPEVIEDTSGEPGVGTGPGWVAVPPPTTGPSVPEPVTNEEWGRNAINHLIAQGYNPSTADSAIRKYLAAEKPSVSEYALITEALRKLGSPPLPLPPGNTTPTTPTPTTVNYSTKITASVSPTQPRLGQTVVIRAVVSWVGTGAAKPSDTPRGMVFFHVDGKTYGRTVYNGVASLTLRLGKYDPRYRDKVFSYRAAFDPSGPRTRSATTSAITVRLA